MKTPRTINSLLLIIALLIIASFFRLSVCFAQNAPKIQWQKCYGGSDVEDSDPHIRAFALTPDGGYILAHRTHSEDYDVAGSVNHGADDAWIVKANSFGVIEWQKCIGGSRSDDPRCIIRTSDNGFIFCGWTASNDGDVRGLHNFDVVGQTKDAWVVKLDSRGNIQWSKCYGGARQDYATSIIQTLDGGYAFTGYTNSVDGDVSGTHILKYDNGFADTVDDAWVVKINNIGKIEWQNCLGGAGYEQGNTIIQTLDSGYIIGGFTTSKEEGFGNFGWGDAYIVRLNSFGGFEWQQTYGDSLGDGVNSILQTSDKNYVWCGYHNLNDNIYSRPFSGDFWIMKLDTLGRKIWDKSYGGSIKSFSYATHITKTSDGGFAVVGSSTANDRDIVGNHTNDRQPDICVFKLTSFGLVEWQKCLGGSTADYGYHIEQTRDGGYAINGCTYSNDGDVSGNHSVFSLDPSLFPIDVWFVKLSPESNSVENSNGGETRFLNAFPNPASDQIHLQLSGSLTVKQVSFYNLMGAQYFPEYKLEQSVATVDVHTLPSGSFVARIVYQDSHQNYLEQVQKFLHYR